MGHIQTRTRGGKKRYVARYVGLDGKEYTKTFDKLGQPDVPNTAKFWLSQREEEVRKGSWVDPEAGRVTLAQYAEGWDLQARKDGTKISRKVLLEDLGPLAHRKLSTICNADVRAWARELVEGRSWVTDREPALAPSTARLRVRILHALFTQAVDDKIIRDNPCKKVAQTLPDLDDQAIEPSMLLSTEQVWALHDAASVTVKPMILVAAATGMRLSELTGLRVRNVDFLRKEVHVIEQAGDKGGMTMAWTRLKTRGSRRTIPLPEIAVDAMANHLEHYPTDRDSPVFRSPRGYMWSRGTISEQWRRACKKAGVRITTDDEDGYTWHDLRHFYASTLIDGGASVRTVMSRLGHTSAQQTLGTYAHLWPGDDVVTRSAVDKKLRRDEDGTAQKAGP